VGEEAGFGAVAEFLRGMESQRLQPEESKGGRSPANKIALWTPKREKARGEGEYRGGESGGDTTARV
jgi:hypothetical protein